MKPTFLQPHQALSYLTPAEFPGPSASYQVSYFLNPHAGLILVGSLY